MIDVDLCSLYISTKKEMISFLDKEFYYLKVLSKYPPNVYTLYQYKGLSFDLGQGCNN